MSDQNKGSLIEDAKPEEHPSLGVVFNPHAEGGKTFRAGSNVETETVEGEGGAVEAAFREGYETGTCDGQALDAINDADAAWASYAATLSPAPQVPAVPDRQFVATVLDRWVGWCEYNEAEFTRWGDGEVPEGAETWTINAKAARALIANDAPRYATPSEDQSGVIGALVFALDELVETCRFNAAAWGVSKPAMDATLRPASQALAAHAASIGEGK